MTLIRSAVPSTPRQLSRAIVVVWLALTPLPALTQTVPTELLDLSIEDLFETRVNHSESTTNDSSRWSIDVSFDISDFEQYYIGTNKVSYDDVLFVPGTEPRTSNNYPVVPTKIRQEIQSIRLTYEISPKVTLRGQLPLVHQSTDHISIIPGYDAFNISSDGIGDIVLLADTVVNQSVNSVLRMGSGVSIPTGSIDEEGDTPRAPGNQQLPYTMQLGSGTWDIPLLLSYQKYEENTTWGLEAHARIRTGKNDRKYALGNTYSAGAWLELPVSQSFDIGFRADYVVRDKIRGGDESLTVPIPGFPFPAPVVNPGDFGGTQIDATLYATSKLSERTRLRVRYKVPVWLDLNGPQSALDSSLSVSFSMAL